MKRQHPLASFSLLFPLLALLLSGCSGTSQPGPPASSRPSVSIEIKSAAFAEGGAIPVKHTCDAGNSSPPLRWEKVPTTAKSVALICEDPDAQPVAWVHWVLYNLPPSVSSLAESVPRADGAKEGALQGKNDFGQTGYSGPCPPSGPRHRYYFRLYALDVELSLKPGATRNQLLDAMRDHVVAEGSLMGVYNR